MKKFLIATAALASIALVGPANAADLPVKAPPMVMPALYNWTGLYIGVEAGAIMGQTGKWDECTNAFCVAPDFTDVGHPMHGGFVGGEAGFNWQSPGSRWVFGIEGDGQWAQLEEALACAQGAAAAVFVCGSRISDFETVRGRIGYAFGPTGSFLVFVTGGWATANQSVFAQTLLAAAAPPTFVENQQWLRHNGFAVGGGAEYGITPWLSVKAEVLYVWLESRTHCATAGIPDCVLNAGASINFPTRVQDDFVLARMGLNARFSWGKGPVAVVARY